jgi:adenosine kinase
MSYKQLLTFGSIAKDELMTHPGVFHDNIDPNNLENLNVFFIIDDLKQAVGGIASNLSYSFNLVSKKDNYILGGIGIDGEIFEKFFEENEIKTDYLKRSSELYSGTFKGIAATNQNQIGAFYYGANLAAKDIKLAEIPDVNESLLIISANHPESVKEMVDQAVDLGLDYAFDPGMMLTWIDEDLLKKGVQNAKFVISNDYEIGLVLQRLTTTIEGLNSQNIAVITTKGEKGVQYKDSNNQIELPAYQIEKFVDPTGAGDAFRAGFLAGLLEEKDLISSLVQGSVLGSFAVEFAGGTNHKFSDSEFQKRLQDIASKAKKV